MNCYRMQVLNLEMLRNRGLDDGCVKMVESGEVSEDLSYLLLQPVGRQLRQDESAATLVKVFPEILLSLCSHLQVHRAWSWAEKDESCFL